MKCPKCQSENPDTKQFCGDCGLALAPSEGVSLTKTLITPKDSLKEGSTVGGRYTIIGELGRGGMGVVYRAEDTKLRRTVALKFLPPELIHIPEVKERFMREAQAAAALDHSNICTVYEFDEAHGANFISMAYIEGQSLKQRFEAGPLGLEEALKTAEQVAEGLREAHKKGIVHRDIKSANIMVTERGQAKIMDFGLARTAEKTLLTKEGTTMGTVAYMSPEQTQGEEVDQRTDIWSFGVVLHEMLTGQLPFKGEHEQGVVYSILNEKPKPITDLRSEIPMSIGQVVTKALEKNPKDRYQQVEELLDDLKSISAGIVPEEIKVRLRKAKLRKRKRTIIYGGAAGLIIIMAVIALSLFPGRAEAIDSIAVLPLENLTGDSEQEFFVDAATDELIGQLAQIGAWRVISRTSVMQYKETEKSLSEIARELNVDALVEGSVYQVGERVRIRVQLIDALPEERNLWGRTYERAKNDVLMMYSEMSRAIADITQVELTAEEMSRLTSARSVNPIAYEAYLKGQFHLYKLTSEDLETAMKYFELALENDPDCALAYSGIAKVWLGRMAMGLAPTSEGGPRAKAAATKALEMDSNQAEVHFALAWVAWLDWEWADAWQAYRQAIALNPNDASARVYYSNFLYVMGNPEEARQQIELALDLDPFNPLFQAIYAMGLMYERRYDEVIELLLTSLQTSPNDPVSLSTLRSAYHQKQMDEKALEIWKTSYAAKGDDEAVEALILGYSENGYSGALSRVAETLVMRSRNTSKYVTPWQIGTLYTRAGKIDEALEWLEKAWDEKDSNMPYIRVDPIFDILRDEPRFQDLIRRMNFPEVE